jgi:acetyl-CoA synthetase
MAAMRYATIVKRPGEAAAAPNLDDYARVRAAFTWAAARAELDGLPGGRGLNIAHEAVDRHAAGPRRDRVALRWLGKTGAVRAYRYGDLRVLSDRFANALDGLGVGRGDRVFALAGRIPELYVAALGTLKHGSVFCPLFSAFGPEPIRARMAIGGARVLVTTEALYHRKVAALRGALPDLAHVVLVGEAGSATGVPGTHDFHGLLAAAADR